MNFERKIYKIAAGKMPAAFLCNKDKKNVHLDKKSKDWMHNIHVFYCLFN